MKIVLALSVCVLMVLIFSHGVGASNWIGTEPRVEYEKSILFDWTPQCSTFYHLVSIAGQEGKTRACYFGGMSPRVAVSFPDNGQIRLLVSSLFNEEFYEVAGGCEGLANCTYSPESDMLVTRYYASGIVSAKIYRNVSSRIKLGFDRETNALRYVFDSTDPDFSFSQDGRPLPVEAVAL
jgi:hypothetical protein